MDVSIDLLVVKDGVAPEPTDAWMRSPGVIEGSQRDPSDLYVVDSNVSG